MAEIKDCIGKNVKISRGSITIKENGKTCGVVKNITSLYDMQPNKQMDFYKKIKTLARETNLPIGKISIKEIIIKDGKMYIFRNVKSKLFYEEHGYFSEEEKAKAELMEKIYNTCRNNGIEVIECIFV